MDAQLSAAHDLSTVAFGSEDDLIAKVVLPFLQLLGYTKEQFQLKVPVAGYRPGRGGRKPEADCVLYAGKGRSLGDTLVAVEVKRADELLPEEQARFYAANLFCPFYICWARYGFEVFQIQNFAPPQCLGSFDLAALSEHQFKLLRSTLSPDCVRTFCNSNEIKRFDQSEQLRQAEAAYVAGALEALRRYRLLDLGRPLDLLSAYVPLYIQALRPRIQLDDDVTVEMERGAHPRMLVGDGADDVRPLQLPNEVIRTQVVVVVGEPGSGKTTELRHICAEVCQAPGRQLPFLVSVRNLVSAGRSLPEALLALLSRWALPSIAEAVLAAATSEGRLLVCVDGLDELDIEDPLEARKALRTLASELEDIRTSSPGNRIVLSCRRESWATCRAILSLPTHDYELRPLSQRSIRQFVAKWFAGDEGDAAADLLTAFARAGWPEFSSNPLLLGLTCIVFERRRRLPERKNLLYQRCIDVLLEEWDSTRRITRTPHVARLTPERVLSVLEDIALHFHERHRACFERAAALSVLASSMPRVGLDPGEAPAAFEDISTQHGLLRSWALDGIWAFPHLCFQEYLAARALRAIPNGLDRITDHIDDPFWSEVIGLYAEIGDSDGLVTNLLDRSDNLLCTHLLSAGACAGRGTKLRDPRIRQVLLERLVSVAASPNDFLCARAVKAIFDLDTPESRDWMMCDYRRADGKLAVDKHSIRYAVATAGEAVVPEIIAAYVNGQYASEDLLESLRYLPRKKCVAILSDLVVCANYPSKYRNTETGTRTHHRRSSAVEAIAAFDDDQSLAILVGFVQMPSLDEYARRWAVRCIGRMSCETTGSELKRVLANSCLPVGCRVWAAELLAPNDVNAKNYLIELVGDSTANHYNRRDAASALAAFPLVDDDLEALNKLLRDTDPNVFWGGPALAAEAIYKIGTPAARGVLADAQELWESVRTADGRRVRDVIRERLVPQARQAKIEALLKGRIPYTGDSDLPAQLVGYYRQRPSAVATQFLAVLNAHEGLAYGGTALWAICEIIPKLPPDRGLLSALIDLAARVSDRFIWTTVESMWLRRDLPSDFRPLFYPALGNGIAKRSLGQ